MEQWEAMLISLAMEVPLVVLAGRALAKREQSALTSWEWAKAAAAATLLTHPFAWWFNESLFYGVFSMWPRMLLIEALVTLAEGLLFGWLCRRWGVGLLISFVVNAVSFGLGLVLWALGLM